MNAPRRGFTPSLVRKKGNQGLEIEWGDGHKSRYSFRYLRQNCPCAACVDEWTSVRRVDPDSILLDLQGLKVEAVGDYALSFSFSDHHETGIYHFDHLRAICACQNCKPG